MRTQFPLYNTTTVPDYVRAAIDKRIGELDYRTWGGRVIIDVTFETCDRFQCDITLWRAEMSLDDWEAACRRNQIDEPITSYDFYIDKTY